MNDEIRKLFPLLLLLAMLLAAAQPAAASIGTEPPKPPFTPPHAPFEEPTTKVLYYAEGENIGDYYGWIGARLGDLNADGLNEYLVSAVIANGGQGKIYVYDGRSGTELAAFGPDTPQFFGYSASDAGDVNADGISDYIVGAPRAARAVVYSGADHSPLLEWFGAAGSFFGASVADAGDVNQDGHADLLVGAPSTANGSIYLYSGADGALLWSRDGNEIGSQLGAGLDLVGDVNADGIPDVVAAAQTGGPAGNGQAYVYSGADGAVLLTLNPTGVPGGTYGQFFARGAGDVNQDGIGDIFIGDYAAENRDGKAYVYSGVDGSILLDLRGQAGEGLGPGRAIDDLNRDGYRDLIIAGYTYGENAAGRIYFVSGKDGSVLRTITGITPNDNLGVDALSVGDLTGDGREEFLLTAVGNDFNGSGLGRAFLVSTAPFKPAHPDQ